MAAPDSELSILDMESDSDISSASSIPSDFFEEIDDWDVSEGEPGVEATARSFPSDFFDEADMDEEMLEDDGGGEDAGAAAAAAPLHGRKRRLALVSDDDSDGE